MFPFVASHVPFKKETLAKLPEKREEEGERKKKKREEREKETPPSRKTRKRKEKKYLSDSVDTLVEITLLKKNVAFLQLQPRSETTNDILVGSPLFVIISGIQGQEVIVTAELQWVGYY